ncbi:FACT complex subunit spt16 [Rhodotorula toruloides]
MAYRHLQEDSKFWKNLKLGDDSGGNYDLKASVLTKDQRIKAGAILCSLSMRRKSHCSNVGRTFMIDPTKDQEKNYLFLINLQKYAIGELRDGATCKDVHQKVVDKINADPPRPHSMVVEFRDPAYPLSAKGAHQLKSDMAVSLMLGFNNITDGKNSQYALSLIDIPPPSSSRSAATAPARACCAKAGGGLDKHSGEGGTGGNDREKQWRRFESSVKDSQLPTIVVDARRLTLILPINGFAVPFHVNTLKSLVKQGEGDYTVLRFLFTTPGAISGKKEDTPFEDPNATFSPGLTYRNTDSFRFTGLHTEIHDLKRAAVKRENEPKETADVVEQGKLVEIKGKRPIRLTEVQLRPSFVGKRQAGDVEIHSNGIRYQSSIVGVKSLVMFGQKETKDVHFFREVLDTSFDETGNKKRKRDYLAEDEFEAEEEEERKRRADLDKYFKARTDASTSPSAISAPRVSLSAPAPQPTIDTLVCPTEPTFLVLTLSKIELAHLGRIQYSLKNFDLVLVFRNFARTPVHISTIPSDQLDTRFNWSGNWSDQAFHQVGFEFTNTLDLEAAGCIPPANFPFAYREISVPPVHRTAVVNALVYVLQSMYESSVRLARH